MGDQDDRGAFGTLQFFQQFQNLRLDGYVERGRRFVGDQQGRFAGQGHGDHHALPHAAGELMRIVVHPACGRRNSDALEHFDRMPLGLLLRVTQMKPGDFGELLADGEKRIERRHRILKDHGDPIAADVGQFVLRHRQQDRGLRKWRGRWRFFPAASGTSPRIARLDTLLPEPLSPTMPTFRRARWTAKFHRRRGRRPRRLEFDLQIFNFKQGAHCRPMAGGEASCQLEFSEGVAVRLLEIVDGLFVFQPRIEGVAEAVTEEVEGEQG